MRVVVEEVRGSSSETPVRDRGVVDRVSVFPVGIPWERDSRFQDCCGGEGNTRGSRFLLSTNDVEDYRLGGVVTDKQESWRVVRTLTKGPNLGRPTLWTVPKTKIGRLFGS